MNEEQLREEREARFIKAFRAGEFLNELTGLSNPFKIESWWLAELLQAELNWLTAQIERGEGMREWVSFDTARAIELVPKHWEWMDVELNIPKEYRNYAKQLIRKKSLYNQAITDLLTPLIERKKEVESKLDANK